MPGLPKKCIAEGIGVFMLTFIGAGSIVTNQWLGGAGIGLLAIAIAHGLALSIAVSATMNVSGGHINPAVTTTMLLTGRIDPVSAAGYIISQIIGATVAAFALLWIFNSLPNGPEVIKATGLGTPAPPTDAAGVATVPALTVFVLEAFLTFLLVFSIFGTAVDPRAPKIGGFGIGLTICADILMGGPISGASMNPARSLGPALASGVWTFHWAYWAGPIVGGLIAGLIYHHLILGPDKKG